MTDKKTDDKSKQVPEEVYTFLTQYYIYQDTLSWGRTQLLVAIEGGVLVAAFAIPQLGIPIMMLGITFLLIIWRLIERDWEVRDQHLEILDRVHDPLGIRMIKKAGSKCWRGSFLLRTVFCVLIGIDALLAVLFYIATVSDCDTLAPFGKYYRWLFGIDVNER